MKLLKLDLKNNFTSLIPESQTDVELLSKLLRTGDTVRARTARKPVIFRDSQTIEGERRAMVLTVRIEKLNLVEDRLRLLGTIQAGPADIQLGAHHTIEVEPGLKLDVYKMWKPAELNRLKRACQPQPELLFCMIDREQADFFTLSGQRISSAGRLVFKKVRGAEEYRDDWYAKIADWLGSKPQKLIVIAGPGFERENLFNWISRNRPALLPKLWLEHASTTGRPGVQEVLKRSGNRLLKQTAIARETELVQELLKQIKEGGLVVYGREEVETALKSGAVRMLMVAEPLLIDLESFIEMAEGQKAAIEIITTAHEAGEMFLGLGGIAAFLRYKI